MIDTHCHIQFKAFDVDREEVLLRCREKGVIMNAVATQTNTSKKAVDMASQHDDVYATIGLHPIHLFPTRVDEEEDSFISRHEIFDEAYYETLMHEKVIAIGETGIDLYHLPSGIEKNIVLQKQRDVFLAQASFAKKHDRPLVIHCRDAHEEMIETMESSILFSKNNAIVAGVIHCFSGGKKEAMLYTNFGFFLGIGGTLTYAPKKTNPQVQINLLEAVSWCPLEYIVVETDAPYLAPQAYRGTRNEPWMIEEVIAKIAEIKNLSFEDVEKQIEKNTKKLFPRIQI